MIRSGTFIVALSIFCSCNTPNDDKNTPINKVGIVISRTKDSVKPELKTKPQGKPLLIARGSEPGWYAEFYSDHLRLLINNGTDSLHLDHNFSDISLKEEYKNTIIQANSSDGNASSLSLVIKIASKECTEASGDKTEKSISLRYNNQNFKGCASHAPDK